MCNSNKAVAKLSYAKLKKQANLASTTTNTTAKYLTKLQGDSNGNVLGIMLMNNKSATIAATYTPAKYLHNKQSVWRKTYKKGAEATYISRKKYNKNTKRRDNKQNR